MNTTIQTMFSQQGHIKLIKRDSKGIILTFLLNSLFLSNNLEKKTITG